jgi:hypothetical protein
MVKHKSEFLLLLFIALCCSLQNALAEPTPPVVPPASACAQGAINYGVVISYLNNGNVYKASVLAPEISSAKTFPEFEYHLAQELALDEQQINFLKSCNLNVAPSCQPGNEVLADTTATEVGNTALALDADQGLSAIQGFFSIPTPASSFDPTEALHNFYVITQGAYCLLHPYSVHPAVVGGLKPPKFS